MKRWIRSLGYGLLFSLPLMLITYAIGQAADTPQETPGETPACQSCHEEYSDVWGSSAHGMALNDPAFITAWKAAGQPRSCLECHVTGYDPVNNTWLSEGVACQACHGVVSTTHPLEPMMADHTGKVCEDCHTETYFQWRSSSHGEHGMDCADCHDPHSTSLKAENTDDLCASCHKELSSNFMHTGHSDQGLACIDCHMSELSPTGEHGISKRDHTFFVDLESCTKCHGGEMHNAAASGVEAVAEEAHQAESKPVDAMAAVEALPVSASPSPVSPLGFTVLAGLVGIAFGIILAPWIDQLRRRERS